MLDTLLEILAMLVVIGRPLVFLTNIYEWNNPYLLRTITLSYWSVVATHRLNDDSR